MALVKCPECGKEISDKANSCVNCGYPLDFEEKEIEEFPELPQNLGIGSQITNWTGGAAIKVSYQGKENFKKIENGNCNIYVHQYGIRISQALYDVKIHRSQIIDVFTFNDNYLTENKVINNALVGGVLFGGIGAVVGGLSGIQKQANGKFIAITYWDKDIMQKVTVSFLAKEPVDFFIKRVTHDLLNAPASYFDNSPSEIEENEKVEKQGKGCFIGLGIAVAVFILLVVLLSVEV